MKEVFFIGVCLFVGLSYAAIDDYTVCTWKGIKHKTGEKWRDTCDTECTCEIATLNHTTCVNTCPKYTSFPNACTLQSPVGNECCSQLHCPWDKKCHYKGEYYNTKDEWFDGCTVDSFKCTCTDERKNFVSCVKRCQKYNVIPPTCIAYKPPGKCCQELRCGADATGLPQRTTTPAASGSDPQEYCYDVVDNCDTRGRSCEGDWAKLNCARYCGICNTHGGNANGAPCVFPYKYSNYDWDFCTVDGHTAPWCATTDDYERDRKWGECHSALLPERCRDYKDDCVKYTMASCLTTYAKWGKKNCQNMCGYCNAVTTNAPTATQPTSTSSPVPPSTAKRPSTTITISTTSATDKNTMTPVAMTTADTMTTEEVEPTEGPAKSVDTTTVDTTTVETTTVDTTTVDTTIVDMITQQGTGMGHTSIVATPSNTGVPTEPVEPTLPPINPIATTPETSTNNIPFTSPDSLPGHNTTMDAPSTTPQTTIPTTTLPKQCIYNGQVHKEGDIWYDGECEEERKRCYCISNTLRDFICENNYICPQHRVNATLQPGCQWVPPMPGAPDQCCNVKDCSQATMSPSHVTTAAPTNTSATMAPSSNTTQQLRNATISPVECNYNGKMYKLGETWYEGPCEEQRKKCSCQSIDNPRATFVDYVCDDNYICPQFRANATIGVGCMWTPPFFGAKDPCCNVLSCSNATTVAGTAP